MSKHFKRNQLDRRRNCDESSMAIYTLECMLNEKQNSLNEFEAEYAPNESV